MKNQAIALCRVSTHEQLENNSLSRQQEAVERCAKDKGVEIVRYWSGDVSSKHGKNLKRTDLKEMLEFCKKSKRIQYLFIDEPDRFMRSIKEAFYFETEFEKLGVKIWYASDPELNNDDLMAKMYRFMKYFTAEGSNEERIHKSIEGAKKSVREGRLPSGPKPGYTKGPSSGLHVIDPVSGIPLQQALKYIAHDVMTPTDSLKWLMATDFKRRYKSYKMDKFRATACEPYYAGIIDIRGNINTRNENGLHEPLITREEHEKILRVFDKNVKKQQGYRPDKETEYPLSNQLTCPMCEADKRKYPRFTSVPLNNGKTNRGKPRKVVRHYAKYKCRECNRYIDRDYTHSRFSELLDAIVVQDSELERLKSKLLKMFSSKHTEATKEVSRLEAVNSNITKNIADKVEAVTDPSNSVIRDEIIASIESLKAQIADNKERLTLLSSQHEADLDNFMTFAFDFLGDKGKKFFKLTVEDMKRCKQLLFMGKIYVDHEINIYTHDLSPIFRGSENEKDTEVSSNSRMVQHS